MWRRKRRRFRRRYHRGFRPRRRRHAGFRRWRRWRKPVIKRTLYQNMPSRHRTVWVRGWEPLANLCKNDGPTSEATPYLSIEPQSDGYPTGVWHGTWGKHFHTPNNLLQRALAGWNSWSDDWTTFDYIYFAGATITIPQPVYNTLLITFDPYLQTKVNVYSEKNKEDLYLHPGVLLNMPHTHIIFPFTKKHRRSFYKIKVRPPPGWTGYQRFPQAMGYILYHWGWTWASLDTAFFSTWAKPGADQCPVGPWWATNSYLTKWKNRTKYDPNDNQDKPRNWGPFLQPKLPNGLGEESFLFFYKIKLKLSGDSIWRPLPTNFQRDGLVPEPEGPNSSLGTKTNSKKKKRPQDVADIWPDDLDSDGILKDRAYSRITAPHTGDKRRKLEDTRRLGSLYDRVYHVLSEFNLLK
nr:ORF1 [Torque teno felis virus]